MPRHERKSRRSAKPPLTLETSPIPENQSRPSNFPQEYCLRACVDFGTSKIAASWQISHNDESFFAKPQDVDFGNAMSNLPNAATWSDGVFLFGREVENRIVRGELSEDLVIRDTKMAMFSHELTAPMMSKVNRQLLLLGKTMSQLVEAILRNIIITIKKDVQHHTGSTYDADRMPFKLFLSVPQMWDTSANRVMSQAAKRADAPQCELVYEPLCAAIQILAEQKRWLRILSIASWLSPGDELAVCDLGAGTGDFVRYRLLSGDVEGTNVSLETMDAPDGGLCGSDHINKAFVKWFEETSRVEDIAETLGYTVADLKARVNKEFEKVKVGFQDHLPMYHVIIFGGRKAADKHERIDISRERMKSFFDEVIAMIIMKIDNMIQKSQEKRVKAIILAGGFGSCEYLQKRLETTYESQNVKILRPKMHFSNSVTRGALLRHKVTVRGLKPQICWGTAGSQEWDPAIHPDATIWERVRGKEHAKPNLDLVMYDPVHPDIVSVVEDRWYSLVQKHSMANSDVITMTGERMFYAYPNEDGGPINIDPIAIYYSEQAVIREHEPIRKRPWTEEERNRNDFAPHPAENLRDGIKFWDSLPLQVDSEAWGWSAEYDRDGLPCYEIQATYYLLVDGPTIKFHWTVNNGECDDIQLDVFDPNFNPEPLPIQ